MRFWPLPLTGFMGPPYFVTVWLSRTSALSPSALALGWPLLVSGAAVQDAATPVLPCPVLQSTSTTITALVPPGFGAGWYIVVVRGQWHLIPKLRGTLAWL